MDSHGAEDTKKAKSKENSAKGGKRGSGSEARKGREAEERRRPPGPSKHQIKKDAKALKDRAKQSLQEMGDDDEMDFEVDSVTSGKISSKRENEPIHRKSPAGPPKKRRTKAGNRQVLQVARFKLPVTLIGSNGESYILTEKPDTTIEAKDYWLSVLESIKTIVLQDSSSEVEKQD
ncbi:MAG: hypothetical protein Q9195_001384 [Heterodermia aff. obscurata]